MWWIDIIIWWKSIIWWKIIIWWKVVIIVKIWRRKKFTSKSEILKTWFRLNYNFCHSISCHNPVNKLSWILNNPPDWIKSITIQSPTLKLFNCSKCTFCQLICHLMQCWDLRLCALGQIGLPKSVGVWGLYSFQSFRVTKMAEMYDVSSRNFLVFAPMNSTILAYMWNIFLVSVDRLWIND